MRSQVCAGGSGTFLLPTATPASNDASESSTRFTAVVADHTVLIVESVSPFRSGKDLSEKLVEAGLVEREQRGKWALFSLKRDAVEKLAAVADLKGV